MGSYDNWQSAFSNGNIRGLPETKRIRWKGLDVGDVLFDYVEYPFPGVVGNGAVASKLYDSRPFFVEDWRAVSEWPWRAKFDLVWPTANPLQIKPIGVHGSRVPLRVGFQFLNRPKSQQLLRRCTQYEAQIQG